MGRGSIIASSPQTNAKDGKEDRDRRRRFVSGGRVTLHDIPKRRNARDKNKKIKESFFHDVSLKAKGPENPTPSPKRLKNHTRLLIANFNGPLSRLEL